MSNLFLLLVFHFSLKCLTELTAICFKLSLLFVYTGWSGEDNLGNGGRESHQGAADHHRAQVRERGLLLPTIAC